MLKFSVEQWRNSMKMWIARDRRGTRLTLHSDKPIWVEEHRVWGYFYRADLNDKEFPEVTFENSPMEVELKLASNENN